MPRVDSFSVALSPPLARSAVAELADPTAGSWLNVEVVTSVRVPIRTVRYVALALCCHPAVASHENWTAAHVLAMLRAARRIASHVVVPVAVAVERTHPQPAAGVGLRDHTIPEPLR